MTKIRLAHLAYGLTFLSVFFQFVNAHADDLFGSIGNSAKWGSSWMDLGEVHNFSAGDVLRITLQDSAAKCVLVRLLGRDDDPNEPVGIVGGTLTVGEDKTVTLKLPADRKLIRQISVHGGTPWGRVICAGNGAARIASIEYTSTHH